MTVKVGFVDDPADVLYIATKIANLGINTFVLHQFKWAQGYDSFLKALRRNKPIRLEDYEFLRENLIGTST